MVDKKQDSKQESKLRVTGLLDRPTVSALQKELALEETGRADSALWSALQELAGETVTGMVHGQHDLAANVGTDIAPESWRYAGMNGNGDYTVAFIQEKLGVEANGQFDVPTVKALQDALNAGLDWS